MKNYYYILGLEKNASINEIKSAYRKLSVKFHPDKNNGDAFFESRFKDINEAYEVLFDSEKRRTYDIKLSLNFSEKTNEKEIKDVEDKLRKDFEEKLKQKEEEIRRKYQTPEQRAKEEFENKRKLKEQQEINEKKNLVSELNTKTISLREKKDKLLKAQGEISNIKSEISLIEHRIIEINSILGNKSEPKLKEYEGMGLYTSILVSIILLLVIIAICVQLSYE